LKEIVNWFQEKHGLEVEIVSQGVSMLWSQFMPKKEAEERLAMKMGSLIEQISKKPIPPHTKQFLVEVVASDVEVPSLLVKL